MIWLRFIVWTALTITALPFEWSSGGYLLVLLSMGWGTCLACGMMSGMKAAPPENW